MMETYLEFLRVKVNYSNSNYNNNNKHQHNSEVNTSRTVDFNKIINKN